MFVGLLWLVAFATTVLWSYGVLATVGALLDLTQIVQELTNRTTMLPGLMQAKADLARWAEAIAVTLLLLAWPVVSLVILSAPRQPVLPMSWRARWTERFRAFTSHLR